MKKPERHTIRQEPKPLLDPNRNFEAINLYYIPVERMTLEALCELRGDRKETLNDVIERLINNGKGLS